MKGSFSETENEDSLPISSLYVNQAVSVREVTLTRILSGNRWLCVATAPHCDAFEHGETAHGALQGRGGAPVQLTVQFSGSWCWGKLSLK